jgi:hypothetical protein
VGATIAVSLSSGGLRFLIIKSLADDDDIELLSQSFFIKKRSMPPDFEFLTPELRFFGDDFMGQ